MSQNNLLRNNLLRNNLLRNNLHEIFLYFKKSFVSYRIHMPSVTYMRLDGSVPAGQRHSLVTRFNNDPTVNKKR